MTKRQIFWTNILHKCIIYFPLVIGLISIFNWMIGILLYFIQIYQFIFFRDKITPKKLEHQHVIHWYNKYPEKFKILIQDLLDNEDS